MSGEPEQMGLAVRVTPSTKLLKVAPPEILKTNVKEKEKKKNNTELCGLCSRVETRFSPFFVCVCVWQAVGKI